MSEIELTPLRPWETLEGRATQNRIVQSQQTTARIADLERQLSEAQGKLSRIETDMCTCNRGLVGMCIVHDKNSLLARILKEEK